MKSERQEGWFRALIVGIFVALLLPACNSSSSTNPPSAPAVARIPIFDQVAGAPKYSNAIAAADRDLPNDEWMTDPFHINLSRGRRVAPIAREILAEVEPEVKRMSVSELVRCLKVEDGSGFVTNYIADALYPAGNRMIIAEIKSRSVAEKKVLADWPRDRDFLDTGSQGPSWTVEQLIRELATPMPEKAREGKDQ